jgi:hypothetical protein
MKATLVATLLVGAALTLAACGGDDGGGPAPTPYPSEIAWEQVPDLLATGEVETVFQTHALDVALQMKDGSQIATTEPGIDDIFRLVDECGDPCADLVLATE